MEKKDLARTDITEILYWAPPLRTARNCFHHAYLISRVACQVASSWFCLGGAWFVVWFVCFGGFSLAFWLQPVSQLDLNSNKKTCAEPAHIARTARNCNSASHHKRSASHHPCCTQRGVLLLVARNFAHSAKLGKARPGEARVNAFDFFPRVRTPCGHGAQVIIEGGEKQSDGGERNKDNPTNKNQPPTTAQRPSLHHPVVFPLC